jgi:hypothetical protein
MMSTIDATPLAEIGSPQLTPLIIMLVVINSSSVPPSFLIKRIWYQVHNRSTIYQHVVNHHPINVAIHMQWLEMVHGVLWLLEHNALNGEVKLSHLRIISHKIVIGRQIHYINFCPIRRWLIIQNLLFYIFVNTSVLGVVATFLDITIPSGASTNIESCDVESSDTHQNFRRDRKHFI